MTENANAKLQKWFDRMDAIPARDDPEMEDMIELLYECRIITEVFA